MLGDYLYQLTPRDLQVTPLQYVFERVTQTGNLVSIVTALFRVPQGRALLLQNLCGNWVGDGVANFNSARISIFGEGDLELCTLKRHSTSTSASAAGGSLINAALSSAVGYTLPWNGLLLVPPQYSVGLTAVFSGASVDHSATLDVAGYLIPRGNLAN